MHCGVHVSYKIHSNIPITDLESESGFLGGWVAGGIREYWHCSFLTWVLVTCVCYTCMYAWIVIVHTAVTMISFYGLHRENKRNIYNKRKPWHLFNNYHQITSLGSQGAAQKNPGSTGKDFCRQGASRACERLLLTVYFSGNWLGSSVCEASLYLHNEFTVAQAGKGRRNTRLTHC